MAQINKREPNRSEFTDRFIRNLIPPNKKTIWWETKRRGLCLQVQSSGYKGFKVVYRSGGLLRWYQIDSCDAVYLKEAREFARQIRAHIAAGEDPRPRGRGAFRRRRATSTPERVAA